MPEETMIHSLEGHGVREVQNADRAARHLPPSDADGTPDEAHTLLLPLTNASFPSGGALTTARSFPDPDSRAIAMAEYHYYRGEAQTASDLSEPYLTSPDPARRLSACWLHGYSNLTLNHADRTHLAFDHAREMLGDPSLFAGDPRLAAEGTLAVTGAATLLHLPVPDGIPPLESLMSALPEGLRLLAVYVNAHRMYLQGDWSTSVGLAEGALSFSEKSHPIPTIYLHMVCVMDRIGLRQPELARNHLLRAWEIARPDGLIEPFAEHHGLLGGMLEKCLKHEWPDDFRRIIDITYRFSYGWRRIHNPNAGHEVADTLSTTQFTCAMLASRDWTNKEIADHLGISTNTVKAYLSEAYGKLGIVRRDQLAPFMLR